MVEPNGMGNATDPAPANGTTYRRTLPAADRNARDCTSSWPVGQTHGRGGRWVSPFVQYGSGTPESAGNGL